MWGGFGVGFVFNTSPVGTELLNKSKRDKVKSYLRTIKFDMSFISIGYLVSTVTVKYIEIINSKEFLAKH